MEVLDTLPTWIKVLGALFAAVVLVALNIGWLLQARALLQGQAQRYQQSQQRRADRSSVSVPPAARPTPARPADDERS